MFNVMLWSCGLDYMYVLAFPVACSYCFNLWKIPLVCSAFSYDWYCIQLWLLHGCPGQSLCSIWKQTLSLYSTYQVVISLIGIELLWQEFEGHRHLFIWTKVMHSRFNDEKAKNNFQKLHNKTWTAVAETSSVSITARQTLVFTRCLKGIANQRWSRGGSSRKAWAKCLSVMSLCGCEFWTAFCTTANLHI